MKVAAPTNDESVTRICQLSSLVEKSTLLLGVEPPALNLSGAETFGSAAMGGGAASLAKARAEKKRKKKRKAVSQDKRQKTRQKRVSGAQSVSARQRKQEIAAGRRLRELSPRDGQAEAAAQAWMAHIWPVVAKGGCSLADVQAAQLEPAASASAAAARYYEDERLAAAAAVCDLEHRRRLQGFLSGTKAPTAAAAMQLRQLWPLVVMTLLNGPPEDAAEPPPEEAAEPPPEDAAEPPPERWELAEWTYYDLYSPSLLLHDIAAVDREMLLAYWEVHHGVTCSVSGMCPIVGPRFKKKDANYDLCEAEFAKLGPEQQAAFVRSDRGLRLYDDQWQRRTACRRLRCTKSTAAATGNEFECFFGCGFRGTCEEVWAHEDLQLPALRRQIAGASGGPRSPSLEGPCRDAAPVRSNRPHAPSASPWVSRCLPRNTCNAEEAAPTPSQRLVSRRTKPSFARASHDDPRTPSQCRYKQGQGDHCTRERRRFCCCHTTHGCDIHVAGALARAFQPESSPAREALGSAASGGRWLSMMPPDASFLAARNRASHALTPPPRSRCRWSWDKKMEIITAPVSADVAAMILTLEYALWICWVDDDGQWRAPLPMPLDASFPAGPSVRRRQRRLPRCCRSSACCKVWRNNAKVCTHETLT